ncbi:MAG: hypothetical protein KGN80_12620, partial [Acidobacteriota bacterium]|nr:hypothetical protein [Acidobacteriota bacterium]
RSATRFVSQIWADNGSSRYFFHEGEKILDLIPPEVREMKDWGFTIHQAEILPGEALGFLYKGIATFGPSPIVMEGNQWVEKKTMTAQQVWFFDGLAGRRLTNLRVAFPPNFAQILRIPGPASPGLLFRVDLSSIGDKDLSKWNSTVFLDFRDPGAGFKPLPQIEVQGGRKVGLDSIAACQSPGEFIASLPEGLFRLSEVTLPARP